MAAIVKATENSAQYVGRDSTVSHLDDYLRAAKEPRRLFEQQWVLQIAFYLGYQWVRVDGSGRVFDINPGEDRVMLTDNRIRPAVRTNIAKMTKSQPVWTGVPKDSSDDEITRARLREIVFEHYWRELKARRRLHLALWYVQVTGQGWWKVTWDKTRGYGATVIAHQGGGPVVTDSYGRPFTPDRVQQMGGMPAGLEQRQVTTGDVCLEVKTPFEVAVDPLATDEGLASAEYVCEEAIYSPAYLKDRFGNRADIDQIARDASSFVGPVEARFPAMSGYLERSRENRGAAGRRGIRVREFWSRPGVDGPRGKHCIWTASGTLLLEEDNPYPFLPYVQFHGLPAGRFYDDAPIRDLISPQTELNKVTSQIADNAERIGNPARLVDVESMVDDNPWMGLPGEEIVYHDLGKPNPPFQWLGPPEMPRYVQERIPQIEKSIATISGQFEVSQGSVPPGVTAAAAIQLLLESNDTQLGPDIAGMADSVLEAGRIVLWLLKAFAGDDRLARISGDDAYEVYSWRGDQLGSGESDEVQVGSGLVESKAMKQQAIHEMLNLFIQNGQQVPARDLRRIMRDYQVGGLDHFFQAEGRDQAQVVDEHRRMLRGELVVINSYDNDDLHVSEHQDFMKSGRYQMLRSQPGGQQIMRMLEAHVAAHKQRLQQQATQQALAMASQQALATGQMGPDPSVAPPGPDPAMTGGDTAPPPGALPSGPEASPSTSPSGFGGP